jgi:alpha-mannosidase
VEIKEAIEKLHQLTRLNIQHRWRYWEGDATDGAITPADSWPVASFNEKGHLPWRRGQKVLWLRQDLIIPNSLNGYFLGGLSCRLALRWWAEKAEIFVNGILVQRGDLFDCYTRVLLTPSAVPGDRINLALRLVSPGHDDGALVSSRCEYESLDNPFLVPSLVADELAVLEDYLTRISPGSAENLNYLKSQLQLIDWEAVSNRERFERSLSQLREKLLEFPSNSELRKNSTIKLLGHAHLDLAWLWPVSETWEAAQRTFESVLNLQEEFPELIFTHSTPALYQWIEENRPDLFAKIQERVKKGQWEIAAGLWVEPELNIISGEAIARQILYGQRYVKEKFGKVSTVAWLPDSFGFCWQLPQFLKSGGIEYFVTQKLRWNDRTNFPYEVFWWRGLDGSEIFSFMSPPIGENIEPVKMAKYAGDFQLKTGLKDAFWLPGVGDHGGGPTRDMLEIARIWQNSPFFPQLEFATVEDYLTSISEAKNTAYPIWNDELYLEFHRGCYTSHCDQKFYNRRCEDLLFQAELFASVAAIATGAVYPKQELEVAWKKVLFNQFHDILPGSAIPQVYRDANAAWREVERVGWEVLETALSAISDRLILSPPPELLRRKNSRENASILKPIVVFNPLNWERSPVATVSLGAFPSSYQWQVWDDSGRVLECQMSDPPRPPLRRGEDGGGPPLGRGEDGGGPPLGRGEDDGGPPLGRGEDDGGPALGRGEDDGGPALLFLANKVPGVGYRVFWLWGGEAESLDISSLEVGQLPTGTEKAQDTTATLSKSGGFVKQVSLEEKDRVLENEFLRVLVDSKTGDLESIFDKVYCREILKYSEGESQLQAFADGGQYWDAWNINPDYKQHPLPPPKLKEIYWVEKGNLRWRLRVVREVANSEFCQDYVLDAGSRVLKVENRVDWQSSHVLVKASFAFNLEGKYLTYEIPCGVIERPTQPSSPRENAKWEVPVLRWGDLSEDGYGVSLLNDCKYGYDFDGDRLRLTLLRGSTWPDPEADLGVSYFTYAIYPHLGGWRDGDTVRRGYELNLPVLPRIISWNLNEEKDGVLPPANSFLNLQAESLILMAFKQWESSQEKWVLRFYEAEGKEVDLEWETNLDLGEVMPVNLLEESESISGEIKGRSLRVLPWKVVSFLAKNC